MHKQLNNNINVYVLLLAILLFLIISVIPMLNKWRKPNHFKYGNALGFASILAIPFVLDSNIKAAMGVGAL